MKTALPLATAPNKPKRGEPCNGCGYCCAAEVCEVGLALCGPETPAPCPLMEFDGAAFRCGAVRLADEMSPAHGVLLRLKMGIGVGCDANDFAPTPGPATPG
jgi:hypothetical protein